MKILVKKSGSWAHRGIELNEVSEGIHEHKDLLAKELILAGWAVPYAEEVEEVEEPGEFNREAAEEEYRELGGRARDDWADEELIERIEKKKAE